VRVCLIPRRRWGNDIKRDLKEVKWGDVDLILFLLGTEGCGGLL
jgi:hypothetical protein